MPLTKVSSDFISDNAITSVKIASSQVGTSDIATNAVTSDKLHTTLDLSSATITLPANSVTHTQLQGTYTPGTDDLKFLQISSAGVLQWANPVTVPIPFTSISGTIANTQLPTGGNAIIDSDRIVDATIVNGDIANTTITDGKLATSLDLSSKTLIFPTTQAFTNVTISGTLTVSGSTTTLDTATLAVEDRLIEINKGESGAGVTGGTAGIQIDRGTSDDATIVWDEANDKFLFKVGGTLANVQYASQGVQNDSVGYPQLNINNTSDPGPGNAYFLESDGNGKLQFSIIDHGSFTVGGVLGGTLSNLTFANGAVSSTAIASKAITTGLLADTISFVGKSVTLNSADILTAIQSASSFNITNTNFSIPNLSITAGKIVDSTITVGKLTPSLDLSAKTLTLPNNIIAQAQMQDNSVGVAEMIIENTGTAGNYLTQSSTGGMEWTSISTGDDSIPWLGGLWPDAKENFSIAGALSGSTYVITIKNYQGNSLTALSPFRVAKRSTTANNSAFTLFNQASNVSLTIPAAKSLGYQNNEDMELYVYCAWSGSEGSQTMKVAVITEYVVDEGSLQTITDLTTLVGVGVKGTLYSDFAGTNIPVRLLGRIKMTQANTLSWASEATEIATNFQTFQLEYV